MSEYIIRVDENDERWHYVEQQYTHFFGYPITDEIVRCRDCKYANEDEDECVYFAAWEPLPEWDEFRDVYVDVEPNGFCAWGEREDGDAR